MMTAGNQRVPAPVQDDAQLKRHVLGRDARKEREQRRQARAQHEHERLGVRRVPLGALLHAARREKEKHARAHKRDDAVLVRGGRERRLQNKRVEIGGVANTRQQPVVLVVEQVGAELKRRERQKGVEERALLVLALSHARLELRGDVGPGGLGAEAPQKLGESPLDIQRRGRGADGQHLVRGAHEHRRPRAAPCRRLAGLVLRVNVQVRGRRRLQRRRGGGQGAS